MYSAGLAETATAAAGAAAGAEVEGAGTAANDDGGPFSHQSRAGQMQQRRERDGHHHSRGGMGGKDAPGWEGGEDWGMDWDWEGLHRQQGNTAAGRESEDDAALLVRWSKALDFDRQALEGHHIEELRGVYVHDKHLHLHIAVQEGSRPGGGVLAVGTTVVFS